MGAAKHIRVNAASGAYTQYAPGATNVMIA
jgi:hypothetical protein